MYARITAKIKVKMKGFIMKYERRMKSTKNIVGKYLPRIMGRVSLLTIQFQALGNL